MLIFRKDDRISHAVHGLGTVVEADDRYTVVSFDTGGVRKFVTRLVQLETSHVPAPPPPPPVRKRRARSAGPDAPMVRVLLPSARFRMMSQMPAPTPHRK